MADLSEVLRSLGRIEGKVDGIDKRLDSGSKRMDTIEEHQRKTDKKVHFFSGIYAAVGLLGGWFFKSHTGA